MFNIFRRTLRLQSPISGHLPLRCHETRLFSAHVPNEGASFGRYSVILPRDPFVHGVSHIVPRTVPPSIARPPYVETPPQDNPPLGQDSRIRLGSEEETKLRAASSLARKVREFAGTLVRPGVTTNSIDAAVHDFIVTHGAYPSPLLYSGFPRSCCTSVNNVVVHGLPDNRPLEDGDIINIDITVYLDGYHGDTSQTFLVGDVDEPGRELVLMANATLHAGIAACGPGRPFNSIGLAIHKLVRDTPYSVCAPALGHGIGRMFHQSPLIYHTPNEEPGTMHPGHCFTIEPGIIQGSDPQMWIFPDGWTVSTENCARSAQAEHTVLITETGVDVLTS